MSRLYALIDMFPRHQLIHTPITPVPIRTRPFRKWKGRSHHDTRLPMQPITKKREFVHSTGLAVTLALDTPGMAAQASAASTQGAPRWHPAHPGPNGVPPPTKVMRHTAVPPLPHGTARLRACRLRAHTSTTQAPPRGSVSEPRLRRVCAGRPTSLLLALGLLLRALGSLGLLPLAGPDDGLALLLLMSVSGLIRI